ncbi:MAG: hypothetical protein BBJ60_07380 [Desulfobacterales bacterium S7086C20]|nr:MAG: hypothetical protein BBJ60_07380 [Desulfobacterales bacterium S7086C20]
MWRCQGKLFIYTADFKMGLAKAPYIALRMHCVGPFFAFKVDERELHWPDEKINGNKGLDMNAGP